MAVSEEARVHHRDMKPIAHATEAELAQWIRSFSRSGLGLDRVKKAFTSNLHRRRRRQMRELKKFLNHFRGLPPFVDDGEDDVAWAADHPRREFRTRPWRPADGEPIVYESPSVTVIHLFSNERLIGIPEHFLWTYGRFPASPRDCDDYGLLLFLTHRASRGWRHKRPEGAE